MLEQYLRILDALREKKLSIRVHTYRETFIAKLNSELFSERLRAYLTPMNTEGEPFTNSPDDPAPVAQVKRILNALYHAELALQEAESTQLRADVSLLTNLSQVNDLQRLFFTGLSHAYRAGHLATHFDIDLLSIFSQEIAALAPLFAMFTEYAENYRDQTWGRLAQMDRHQISHQAGFLTGVIVDQLDPQAAEPDYESLVPALADQIPQVLDQVTTFIEGLSSSIKLELSSSDVSARTVDDRQLDELQDHALQLLNALDGARGSSLFLPLQFLHYIHAISHTITLTVSIYKQVGKLSNTTQDTARTKLKELKKLLTVVLGLADKIEEHSMLQPGTLSQPMAAQISRLYQVLILYVEKFVEFSQHQSLLTLDDSEFVEERLAYSYDRMASDTKALLMIEGVRAAAAEFFRILQNPQYKKGMHIADLPADIRDLLAQHYKLLQPHVIQTYKSPKPYTLQSYIPLNKAIIDGLKGERGAKINHVLSLQPDLEALLAKLQVSHIFNLGLKADLISSVAINVQNLKLSPHSQRKNPFIINELIALGGNTPDTILFDIVAGNNQVRYPQNLTAAQAVTLYNFYQTQCAKLDNARRAYQDFLHILQLPIDDDVDIFIDAPSEGEDVDEAIAAATNDTANVAARQAALVVRKRKLRNLYHTFQPYIEDDNAALLSLEGSIIAALSSEAPQAMAPNLLVLLEPVEGSFTALKQRLCERGAVFERVMLECARIDNQAMALELQSTTDRASHVFKHKEFSASVAKFRLYLSKQIPLFNSAIRDHLAHNPAKDTLPFPNIENANQRLTESSQLLALKQAFNCLYYLEKVVIALEELNDNTLEITYTFKILEVLGQAAQAHTILESLAKTPYLLPMIEELQQKFLHVRTTLTGLQGQYFPEPIPAQPDGAAVSPHTPIFYAVNAMLFLPAHINALRVNQGVQADAAQQIHEYAKRVTADLKRILNKSGSYLKLSSEVLTMYCLFRDLKVKLLELTTASHDIVFSNLNHIKDELFTSILIELERWEDSICLEPGSLTQPLTDMFDAFYTGLLEPLRLKSHEHISLVGSEHPLVRRQEVVEERRRKATLERNVAQEQQRVLQHLLDSIASYKECGPDEIDQGLLQTYQAALVRSFHNALPLLNAENARLSPDIPPGNAADAALDALLMESVEGELPNLKNIEALTVACLNNQRGVQASQQLIVDTANGKLAHLTNLLLAQPDLMNNFVDLYAAASFKKRQTLALNAQRVGLVDSRLRKEYADALEKQLQDAEAGILVQAKADPNIDNKISELIQAEIEKFYTQNYRNYCHLDGIIGAVTRLGHYVEGCSRVLSERGSHVFEGKRTLKNKKREIKNLETFCYENSCYEINQCGLVKMQTDPMQTPFANIEPLLAEKNAVILYNNEIFYADFAKKVVSKIVVAPEKHSDFDKLKSAFTDDHKFANEQEYGLISSLRGRTLVLCGLVKTQADPIQTPFANIEPLLAGKNAVILYNNEIFYADFAKKEVSKIIVAPEKQSDFDKLKAVFTDNHKFANKVEYSLISSLRGRTLTVSERIESIQRYLTNNKKKFQGIMCGYQHNNFLTLAWLQHRIAWLFELVGIYTPERKAGYQQLVESVAKPPENASHLGMLGIFSTEQHRRGYALRGAPQQAAGAEQPEAPIARQQPALA